MFYGSRRIRDAAFCALMAMFASMFFISATKVDLPSVPLGVVGIGVILLTLRVHESKLQKSLFLVAGGSAAAIMLTWFFFRVFKPAGDGGGPTVGLLLFFSASFLISSLGCIVLMIKRLFGKTPPTR